MKRECTIDNLETELARAREMLLKNQRRLVFKNQHKQSSARRRHTIKVQARAVYAAERRLALAWTRGLEPEKRRALLKKLLEHRR